MSGGPLQIRRRGESGPAVVLVHGIPGSAAVWSQVADELADAHRLFVPDLVGFGASRRTGRIDELWADQQAEALIEALDAAGVERAVFAGHDFGGPVALSVAALRPELIAGLCLAATNVFPDTPIPLPIRAVTWPVLGPPAERLLFSRPSLRIMLRQRTSVALDLDDHLGDGDQVRSIGAIFAHALRNLESLYGPLEDTLRELDVPVLVAWGDRDPFFSLAQGERTADAARRGRLVVHRGAGHFLPAERPRELAAQIRELVAEVHTPAVGAA